MTLYFPKFNCSDTSVYYMHTTITCIRSIDSISGYIKHTLLDHTVEVDCLYPHSNSRSLCMFHWHETRQLIHPFQHAATTGKAKMSAVWWHYKTNVAALRIWHSVWLRGWGNENDQAWNLPYRHWKLASRINAQLEMIDTLVPEIEHIEHLLYVVQFWTQQNG